MRINYFIITFVVIVSFVELKGQKNDLTFDPPWVWNTFIGSSGYDNGYSSVLDGLGNIYVLGESDASWGSPVNDFKGTQDVFVAKLSGDGELIWNTFIGDGFNYAGDIAIGEGGNIYITGQSWQSWGEPINDFSGGQDAFVAKLGGNDGTLIWNTFLGSGNGDFGKGIATEFENSVYVTGYSESTWGSPVSGHSSGLNSDAFVAKLNSDGALVWNTFLGSDAPDEGVKIAVDGFDSPYITGRSGSSWGDPVYAHSGSDDILVAKLDDVGSLIWNTFLGSGDSDYGIDIALDRTSKIYVVGSSRSFWGNPANNFGGNVCVAKLNSIGELEWNSFLGSPFGGGASGIATHVFNTSIEVYISGASQSEWGEPEHNFAGGDYDGFLAKIKSSGEFEGNTFFGSTGNDFATGIAAGYGFVFVTGTSGATWGTPKNEFSGLGDAFEVKINVADWTTNVEEETPLKFQLSQNYPNPFSKGANGNITTTIEYSIGNANSASPSIVSLKVYDILGREVATLVNKEQAPGNYSVQFSAENLCSGIYFYKLNAGNFSMVKKMILLK